MSQVRADERRKRLCGIAGGLMMLVICVSLVGGLVWATRHAIFMAHMRRTSAVVTRVERSSYAPKPAFWPTFRFDVEGRAYLVRASQGRSGRAFTVGETIPVMYRADDPSQTQVDDGLGGWLGPGLFLLVSSGLFGALVWDLRTPGFRPRHLYLDPRLERSRLERKEGS